MKIAYLFSRYPVPSQTFCDTEICALEACGHEIEIYSCSAPTTSFRHGNPGDWPRATVFYAPPASILTAWEDAARRDGTWPGEMVDDHEARFGSRYDPTRRAVHALYFADLSRRRRVEHLHVHFANRATHAALFVHHLTAIPFSFTAHGQDFLVDLGNDDLLRLMCERAAFVVAVSEWSRRVLAERCPDAGGKIHRIYNGLPPGLSALPPGLLSSGSRPELKIFSVGRLIEFKGFRDLIAAGALLRERGIPFSLEIAGEGSLRADLAREAEAFTQPGARIELSGLLFQEEVGARMRACDVFALACRIDENGASDVLPTVILEAMAAAKPVISTRLAAVPEMVDDGVTGLLVTPGDPVALADALVTMARDENARDRMGRAGFAKVRAEFVASKSARQLESLFSGARVSMQVRSDERVAAIDCFTDRWPWEAVADKQSPQDLSLLAGLVQAFPDARWTAFKPGKLSASGVHGQMTPALDALLRVEFLPDAVVLESVWRKSPALAHKMESWRREVGGACGGDEFLLACRRALYLWDRARSRQENARHLHAVGPAALLCVWLLRRLGMGRSASFLLPPTSGGGVGVAGSTLRRLSPAFAGGWVPGERKLADSLGSDFRGEKFCAETWASTLQEWSLEHSKS